MLLIDEFPIKQLGTVFGLLNFIVVGMDQVAFLQTGIGIEIFLVRWNPSVLYRAAWTLNLLEH